MKKIILLAIFSYLFFNSVGNVDAGGINVVPYRIYYDDNGIIKFRLSNEVWATEKQIEKQRRKQELEFLKYIINY